jgi:hypothetical protein
MLESIIKATLAHKNIVTAGVALVGLLSLMVPAPAQAQFIGLFDYNPQINSNSVNQEATQNVEGPSFGSIGQSADTTQSNSHTGGTVSFGDITLP